MAAICDSKRLRSRNTITAMGWLAVAAGLLALPGYAAAPPDGGAPPDAAPVAPAATCLGPECTLPEGLRYVELRVGKGASPQPGDRIVIHYTGWFQGGKRFDTSRGRRPWSFVWGQNQVIRGYELGMATMRVGGRRKLLVPAMLAYGEKGFKDIIPPNADLVFDVELLSLKPAPAR